MENPIAQFDDLSAFDFSGLFDCEESHEESTPLEPVFSANPKDSSTTTTAESKQDMLVAPPSATDQPFVNVYMIVDPTSNSCMVPKQLISYKVNDVISSVVFGPLTIPAPGQQAPEGTTAASPVPPAPAVVTPSISSGSSVHSVSDEESSVAAPAATTTSGDLPPLRALSAYNFFFRDERDRILHGSEPDWSESKKQRLLEEHWCQDRTKKRRHRKTHGKIDFTSLSKLISSRWKKLPESEKDFYRQIAKIDFERFKQETKGYQSKGSSS